ncbi:hypothetical protein DE146DRAFT_648218 [Phaeosphaeria sp. MPI-PUGE-AT-0046c]|nr:hypothetical protein DE146DRAFT_648218 [Phaeosphaeria sp. MPI-PUGE-AT-0046c]
MPSGSSLSTSSSPTSSEFLTSLEVGTSTASLSSAWPSPTGGMQKNGEWRVFIHLWSQDGNAAKIEWELFDPNKNEAGRYSVNPMHPYGKDSIFTLIESIDRPEEHQMPFSVKAWYDTPLDIDEARVSFEIQKDMADCDKLQGQTCKPTMVTENRIETKAFFVDSCWSYCEDDKDRKLMPSQLGCDDLNDNDWFKDGNAWRRDFYCYWHGF